jgi:formylglycine-generating enzyme required for sulfatase activity
MPANHKKYSGSDNICEVAWFNGNNGGSEICGTPPSNITGTKPVKTKIANKLGLHDMNGNVSEWCWDGQPGPYGEYPQTTPDGDTTSDDGSQRYFCGGHWSKTLKDDPDCSVYDYSYGSPASRIQNLGFRVVCK